MARRDLRATTVPFLVPRVLLGRKDLRAIPDQPVPTQLCLGLRGLRVSKAIRVTRGLPVLTRPFLVPKVPRGRKDLRESRAYRAPASRSGHRRQVVQR